MTKANVLLVTHALEGFYFFLLMCCIQKLLALLMSTRSQREMSDQVLAKEIIYCPEAQCPPYNGTEPLIAKMAVTKNVYHLTSGTGPDMTEQ